MSEKRTTWGDKPYYSLDFYLKESYGQKIYKLALDGGMTCPNRDGTLGTRGCLFCSAGGSGEFAASHEMTLTEQIEHAKRRVSSKVANVKEPKYIAYFQSYTNTYASIDYMRELFMPVIQRDDIIILSIGTRPDCISDECIELLADINKIKPVWIELGLQTIHERTAQLIRRGYTLDRYTECVNRLREHDIDVITHLILGLPGENREDMLSSVRFVGEQGVQGIKMHLLHILKDTDLAVMYEKAPFTVFTLDSYADLITEAISVLPQDIVIHRLTGDGAKKLLLQPQWSVDKKNVMNRILREFRETGRYQGGVQ